VSDYRARSIARRDARHTRGSDEHAPVAGQKDTKRWCRGKVGTPHTTRCVRYDDVKRAPFPDAHNSSSRDWRILICTACGKELANYWPLDWGAQGQEKKPDWVTE
jgi:hypothetical protein